MKTGIVMEVGNGSAVVMLSGGQFQKVAPQGDWEVGETVTFAPEKKRLPARWAILLAAACMAFVVTSALACYQFLFRTVSVIGMDINPSISLELNRLNKVTSAKGVNDDGTDLLQGLRLDGMDYIDALDTLLACEALSPHLENGKYLVFSLYSGTDPDKLRTNIEQVLQEVHRRHANLEISFLDVDRDDLDEARREGISPARLLMLRQLALLDPDASPAALTTMGIGELYGAIVSSGETIQGSDGGAGTVIEGGKPSGGEGDEAGSPSTGGGNAGNNPDSSSGGSTGGGSSSEINTDDDRSGGDSSDSNSNSDDSSSDGNNGNNSGGNSPDSNNGNNSGGNSPDSNNGNNSGGNSPDSNNGNNSGGNSPDSNNGNGNSGNNGNGNNGNNGNGNSSTA